MSYGMHRYRLMHNDCPAHPQWIIVEYRRGRPVMVAGPFAAREPQNRPLMQSVEGGR